MLRSSLKTVLLMIFMTYSQVFAADVISCKAAAGALKEKASRYVEMSKEEFDQTFSEISDLIKKIDEQLRNEEISLATEQTIFNQTYSLMDRLNPSNKKRKNDLKKIEEIKSGKEALSILRWSLVDIINRFTHWTELSPAIKDFRKFQRHLNVRPDHTGFSALLVQNSTLSNLQHDHVMSFLKSLEEQLPNRHVDESVILTLAAMLKGMTVEQMVQRHLISFHRFTQNFYPDRAELITLASLLSGATIQEAMDVVKVFQKKYHGIYNLGFVSVPLAAAAIAAKLSPEEAMKAVSYLRDDAYELRQVLLAQLLLMTKEEQKISETLKKIYPLFPEDKTPNGIMVASITAAAVLGNQSVEKLYKEFNKTVGEGYHINAAAVLLLSNPENIPSSKKNIVAIMTASIAGFQGQASRSTDDQSY